MNHNLVILCSVLFLLFSLTTSSQPLEIDNRFGDEGIVNLDLVRRDNIASVLTQKDNKIVCSLSNVDFFRLARLYPDGMMDRDFGNEGVTMADFKEQYTYCRNVALHADGRLTVVGYVQDSLESLHAALAQFLPDGTLNMDFGNNGKITTKSRLPSATGLDIAVQVDGKILIVGKQSYEDYGNEDFIVLRFEENGTIDEKFGVEGIVTTSFGGTFESAKFIKLQSDGKILVGGYSTQPTSDLDFAIARYNTNGQLDDTYGESGKVVIDFNEGYDSPHDMIIQSDGKLLLCGSTTEKWKSKADIGMVRLQTDGTLDETFGHQGKVVTESSGSSNVVFQRNERPFSFIQTPEKKILVAGRIFTGNIFNGRSFLAQYTEAGVLDKDFGDNGIYIDNENDAKDKFLDLLSLQPDGKILYVGTTSKDEQFFDTDIYIIRYAMDSELSTSVATPAQYDLSVYPNPASYHLAVTYTLKQTKVMTIQLVDAMGRTVETIVDQAVQPPANYNYPIRLSDRLENGVYLLKFSTSDEAIFKKVIVVR
ncbi:MAG: T9SS type A sorting domain-containing protein [Bacteroidota bacterium]